MPIIESAIIKKLKVSKVTVSDVSAVADTGTEVGESVFEFGFDRRNVTVPHTPVNSKANIMGTTGKVDASMTMTAKRLDTGGIMSIIEESDGSLTKSNLAFYIEYMGDGGNDKTLRAIMVVETAPESRDPNGVVVINITLANRGDEGILVKDTA